MQEALKVERLSKSYGNSLAVDSLNLCVRQNTVFGLLGANGTVKSTTIECILGTRKADSGGVSVLGRDPQKRPARFAPKGGRSISRGRLSAGNQSFETMRGNGLPLQEPCRLEIAM